MTTITISGTPGSGKSTVCNLLSEKLGLKYIYSGQIFREKAKKYNMTLTEFGKYCEYNENIDKKLDQHQLDILKKGEVILEGRIAGWIAHKNKIQALKIILDADIETRVNRIIKRENGDFEKRKFEIKKREESEAKRYKKYYNINIKDKSIYDVEIDTAKKTSEEIVDIIINRLD